MTKSRLITTTAVFFAVMCSLKLDTAVATQWPKTRAARMALLKMKAQALGGHETIVRVDYAQQKQQRKGGYPLSQIRDMKRTSGFLKRGWIIQFNEGTPDIRTNTAPFLWNESTRKGWHIHLTHALTGRLKY